MQRCQQDQHRDGSHPIHVQRDALIVSMLCPFIGMLRRWLVGRLDGTARNIVVIALSHQHQHQHQWDGESRWRKRDTIPKRINPIPRSTNRLLRTWRELPAAADTRANLYQDAGVSRILRHSVPFPKHGAIPPLRQFQLFDSSSESPWRLNSHRTSLNVQIGAVHEI